jgi:prefoldin subunit 5|tara:strand:- start:5993 stop:6271 length:279 start_codon:yes stop_codon:yes gene_type:complete
MVSKMTWEKILKMSQSELEDISARLEDLTLHENYSRNWDGFVIINEELEELASNNNLIDKEIDNIWRARDDYNSAIDSLATLLSELAEEEGE